MSPVEQAWLKAFTSTTLSDHDKRIVCRFALHSINFARANAVKR